MSFFKSTLYLVVLSISISSFAQELIVAEMGGTAIKQFDKREEKVNGEPYFDDDFKSSIIKGIDFTVETRYNAYADEIEYEVGDQLYYLNHDLFPDIVVSSTQKHYFFTTYIGDKGETINGYLIVVKPNSKYALYKKEKIIYIPEKKAETTYGNSTPPQLKPLPDTYYMKINDKIVEVNSNKKKFANNFPNQEKKVLEILKKNNISLDSENDLIKLIPLLENL